MSQKYASFIPTTRIPYKIVFELAGSESQYAEDLFKLLKYADRKCLEQPNLTFDEKMDMVWKGDEKDSAQQNLFSIFLKPLVSSALDDAVQQNQIRIYKATMNPRSQYEAVLLYEFDVIVNDKTPMVENEYKELVERSDLIEALLIELISGLDVGIGINYLRFDRMQGGNCTSNQNISNSKSIYGRSFLLALKYIDTSKDIGGECG